MLTSVESVSSSITWPVNVWFGRASSVTVVVCPTFTFGASLSVNPTFTSSRLMSVRSTKPELDDDEELDVAVELPVELAELPVELPVLADPLPD